MSDLVQNKVQEVYQAGSDALIAQEFEKAVAIFDEIGNHLDCYESTETIDTILKVLSNRGLAQSKLRNDAAAIEDFSNLLDRIDIYRYLTNISSGAHATSSNSQDLPWSSLEVKTLIRRATSYESIEEFQKALNDLTQLQRHYGEMFRQNTSLQVQWLRLGHRIEEDRLAAKEDGRPSWMAHAHQSLRLNLIRALPDQLRVGQPFTCQLALGNELGLFDRSIFIPNRESKNSEDDSHWGVVKFEVFTVERYQGAPTLQLLCRDHPSDYCPVGVDGKVKMHLMFSTESLCGECPTVDILLRFSVWQKDRISTDSINIMRESNILPVISIPVSLRLSAHDNHRNVDIAQTSSLMSQLKAQIIKMQINCLRPVQIPTIPEVCKDMEATGETFDEVLCGESVGLLGIGGKIWDSTFVLIKYLYSHRFDYVTGRKVLELGAGTGITSLALSRLHPAGVLCTDLPDVAPLISVNVQLNTFRSPSLSAVLAGHYRVLPLVWGETLPTEAMESEIIIASDVVYYPEGYEPLLQTLEQLLSSSMGATKGKCCILAHRHRHPEDHRFFSMLSSSSQLQTKEIMWQQELLNIDSNTSNSTDNNSVSLKDVRLFQISSKNEIMG